MKARSQGRRSLGLSAFVVSLAMGVVPLTAAIAVPQAATAASAATVQASTQPDPVGNLVNEVELFVDETVLCNVWQLVSSVPNHGLCG